jgi:hypothetical protein
MQFLRSSGSFFQYASLKSFGSISSFPLRLPTSAAKPISTSYVKFGQPQTRLWTTGSIGRCRDGNRTTTTTASMMLRTPMYRPTGHHLLSHHLGAVSHLSSFPGGGGSRRPGGGGGNRVAQGIGVLGAASVLLGKTKYLLGVLKLTKLASLGSMFLTIGTYSMFFGLPYAIGMVGLITIHEAGHAFAMYNRGIPFSPMVFMPFLGYVLCECVCCVTADTNLRSFLFPLFYVVTSQS